ncbi:MAG TPA: nuclear transport factor 2 family protein [Cyclobacteriaceae bacterium]|nr:nuclear transport factor 2 family protein [Cyclobacteriaceae bacterium]
MKRIVELHNRQLEQAFRNQDLDALAKIYAPNARLCPDGDRFYVGIDEILKFWSQDFSVSRVTQMSTQTWSVAGNEDVIYETGITQVTSVNSGAVHQNSVKYINVWTRHTDNTYKLTIDFWNNPAPDQPLLIIQ